MILFAEITVDGLDLVEVEALETVQLEPGWLLAEAAEREGVLVRRVQDISSDVCGVSESTCENCPR